MFTLSHVCKLIRQKCDYYVLICSRMKRALSSRVHIYLYLCAWQVPSDKLIHVWNVGRIVDFVQIMSEQKRGDCVWCDNKCSWCISNYLVRSVENCFQVPRHFWLMFFAFNDVWSSAKCKFGVSQNFLFHSTSNNNYFVVHILLVVEPFLNYQQILVQKRRWKMQQQLFEKFLLFFFAGSLSITHISNNFVVSHTAALSSCSHMCFMSFDVCCC